MNTNAALKALLLNARLIYLVKKQQVNAPPGAPTTKCELLDQKYQTLFGHLANPQLWSKPIPFAAGTIASPVLALDQVDASNTNDFLQKAQALYDLLTNSLLQTPLAAIATTSTSTWNIKMLNALRLILQTIDGRKAFFKRQGTDLDQHDTFPQMETQQLQLMTTYRQLLKSDAIKATESRVRNVKTRNGGLANESHLDGFLKKYNNLNKYISKQVKTVSELPLVADTPSTNNWQTLEILSRTLVLMGQQIATLAVEGKDFTQESNFATLSTEQQDLQGKYQEALVSNDIDSTSDDVDQLQQIATAIPNIQDLSSLEVQYKAINQWLTTAVATLA